MDIVLQKEIYIQREKERKVYFNRENGCWKIKIYPQLLNIYRDGNFVSLVHNVPKTVNIRAMHYIEHMVVNFPEWTNIKSVGEFRNAFIHAFVKNLEFRFDVGTLKRKCENWDTNLESGELYIQFRSWIAKAIAEYTSSKIDNTSDCILPNPWHDPVWKFGYGLSFENCLWALCSESKAFVQPSSDKKSIIYGLLHIDSMWNNMTDNTKFSWLTTLDPYTAYEYKSLNRGKHYL